MSGNISMVSLGVVDIARSRAFYEALGWTASPASQDTIAFMIGHSLVLGLYGRAALAEDAHVDDSEPGFAGVAFAFNRPSEEAVDAFFETAINAGAEVKKQPQKVFWGGYSGYFTDPDGHLWEVAHNPFVPVSEAGVMDMGGGAA